MNTLVECPSSSNGIAVEAKKGGKSLKELRLAYNHKLKSFDLNCADATPLKLETLSQTTLNELLPISNIPNNNLTDDLNENLQYKVQTYNEMEGLLLDKLEKALSFMDNFTTFQAIFPVVYDRTKEVKLFKPVHWIVCQISGVYLVVLAINLKRYIQKLIKIRKLIVCINNELIIISKSFDGLNDSVKMGMESNLQRYLNILASEKTRCIVEIVGFVNDFFLNLNLAYKKFKLTRGIGKFMGMVSWMVSIYRMCSDAEAEEKNDRIISELKERYIR